MPCPCARTPPRFVTTGIFLGCHGSRATPIIPTCVHVTAKSTKAPRKHRLTGARRCFLYLMQTDGSVKILPPWSLTGLVASIWICGLVPDKKQFCGDLTSRLAQDQLQRQYGFIHPQCRQFLSGMTACYIACAKIDVSFDVVRATRSL